MEVDTPAPTAAAPAPPKDDANVEVRFVTSLGDAYRVTETPFSLPLRLTRMGLSEVVNHLLASESPVPFDFLVAGEFLRSSLLKHLAERGVAPEGTIVVEYVLAVGRPQDASHHEHGDWVGACCGSVTERLYASGAYDSRLRIWRHGSAEVSVGAAHAGPIKALAALRGGVASAGKDGVIKLWNGAGDVVATLAGHKDAVSSLDTAPEGAEKARLCSASWDKTIRIWDAAIAPSTGDAAPAQKRRKTGATAAEGAEEREAVAVLEGHTEAVTCVQWPTWAQLISGSHDHTIRLWDAERGTCVTTITGEKSVACVSYSTESGVCASGHHDGALRLWDPRAEPPTARAARSHRGWITGVAWHPRDAAMLATSSYDGSLKLWDLRSAVPLMTVAEAHGPAGKVFCVAWAMGEADGSFDLLSGGSDGRLSRRTLPSNLRH